LQILSASLTSFAPALSAAACSICSRLRVGLGQALVVGHLLDHGGDARAELGAQLVGSGGGVLDGVVQQRRGQHLGVGHAALARQHLGQRDRVVDVGRGLGVLAPLVAVLVRGERQRRNSSARSFSGFLVTRRPRDA
jgi:hypothetical protein